MEEFKNEVKKTKVTAELPVEEVIDTAGALILDTENQENRIQGLRMIQLQLRTRTGPAAEYLIETGLTAALMDIASAEATTRPEMAYLAEIISNIASCKPEITQHIVELGALPILMGLVTAPDTELKILESAVWALGNIAGDSVPLRNAVIDAGALDPIIQIMFKHQTSTSLLKICIWAISNLPRGGRFSDELLKAAPTATALLFHPEKEIVCDALWTLSFLSDGPNHRQSYLVELRDLVPTLLPMLKRELELQVPALRTVGNLLSGDNSTTQVLIDAGAVEALVPLLKHPKNGVRKEACWSLSNIFGGTSSQIKRCLDAGTMGPLIQLVLESRLLDVSKEAAWCVVNALTGCHIQDVERIVKWPVCAALVQIMNRNDHDIRSFGATSILKILNWANTSLRELDDTNPYLEFFRQNLATCINGLAHENADAETIRCSYFSSHSSIQVPWLADMSI